MNTLRNDSNAGFTLVEMLLVVTIVGILVSIVAVRTMSHTEEARRQATWVQALGIKTSIAQFEMAVGRFPRNLNELVIEGDANWPGPFMDSETVPKDGWGNDFQMKRTSKRLWVISPGPDGEFGTEDDLKK